MTAAETTLATRYDEASPGERTAAVDERVQDYAGRSKSAATIPGRQRAPSYGSVARAG